jgi:predicted MPP superfamily phosphohydrolase
MIEQKMSILIAMLLAILTLAFWNGIIIKKYNLLSPKIAGHVRIVLLSDLHSQHQAKLPERISALKPDLIALAGE